MGFFDILPVRLLTESPFRDSLCLASLNIQPTRKELHDAEGTLPLRHRDVPDGGGVWTEFPQPQCTCDREAGAVCGSRMGVRSGNSGDCFGSSTERFVSHRLRLQCL